MIICPLLQIFDLFDVKRKGVIDFGDFVRSLNVFHPNASLEEKTDCKLTINDFIRSLSISSVNPSSDFLFTLLCIISQSRLGFTTWTARATLSAKRYTFIIVFSFKSVPTTDLMNECS